MPMIGIGASILKGLAVVATGAAISAGMIATTPKSKNTSSGGPAATPAPTGPALSAAPTAPEAVGPATSSATVADETVADSAEQLRSRRRRQQALDLSLFNLDESTGNNSLNTNLFGS